MKIEAVSSNTSKLFSLAKQHEQLKKAKLGESPEIKQIEGEMETCVAGLNDEEIEQVVSEIKGISGDVERDLRWHTEKWQGKEGSIKRACNMVMDCVMKKTGMSCEDYEYEPF